MIHLFIFVGAVAGAAAYAGIGIAALIAPALLTAIMAVAAAGFAMMSREPG